jgi:hypothetical protein
LLPESIRFVPSPSHPLRTSFVPTIYYKTHHSNPYSTFYLYFHYYYSPTHSLTITIIHPYHYHQSLHSVISNIFTVI